MRWVLEHPMPDKNVQAQPEVEPVLKPGVCDARLRACLVKVRVRFYAFSYGEAVSDLRRTRYDRLREDGVEVESFDEGQATPHANLLEDV
jgi:hypothetical protein